MKNTGAIEIVRLDKTLEEVYFPIRSVNFPSSELQKLGGKLIVRRRRSGLRTLKRSEYDPRDVPQRAHLAHPPSDFCYMHDTIRRDVRTLMVTNASSCCSPTLRRTVLARTSWWSLLNAERAIGTFASTLR